MTTQTYRRVDLAAFEGHTPGPWHSSGTHYPVSGVVVPVRRNLGTINSQHSAVAVIPGAVNSDYHASGEPQANARLIAAAPEMAAELAALREQIQTLRKLMLKASMFVPFDHPLHETINAALAATSQGETP